MFEFFGEAEPVSTQELDGMFRRLPFRLGLDRPKLAQYIIQESAGAAGKDEATSAAVKKTLLLNLAATNVAAGSPESLRAEISKAKVSLNPRTSC